LQEARRLRAVNDDLPRSQAYLAEAQRLSRTGSFGWRISTGEILWSEETFRIFQYDRTTAPTVAHVLQRVHPEDAAAVQQTIERAAQDGKDFDHEYRLVMPDGSVTHVHVVAHAIGDQATGIEFAGSVRDVTAAKKAEEVQLRLGAIVASSDDAIISKTLGGIITSWNAGAQRIFGYTAEEAVGRPISMLIPADRHAEEALIIDRLKRGESVEHFETVRIGKDAREIHVSLAISPIKGPAGRIIGASKIARDITGRKQSETQISILAREAEHRAKNVLATVQAIVHLTQSDTPEDLKHAIEGRIQALANVHALFVESRWSGAELHNLVMQELSPYCQEGETRARIDGPTMMLDPAAAQTIAVTLHELATNAAKYGALSVKTGHVQVEWSRAPDGRLLLRWSETGGPPVKPPTRQGFGTRVMEGMIRGQLRGEMRFAWRAEGLVCEIVLPG
jgi:PAS domain S-box-containing protein